MLCILHITSFICNPNDDKNIPATLGEHISFGMMFVFLLGWLTVLMLFAARESFKDIKKNKLIPLYLYDIENFAKIGEIPEDKFILFSDENGVVLAEKQYKDESRTFSFGVKYFYEFEDYYEKHSVNKNQDFKEEMKMNVTVKEFILTNKNRNVKWKIDGMLFESKYVIPDNLFEKHVFDWTVNQKEGIIEIKTEYHE